MQLSVLGLVSIDTLNFEGGQSYVGGGGLATAWVASLWGVNTTLYSINSNSLCNKIIERNLLISARTLTHKDCFNAHETTRFSISQGRQENEFSYNISNLYNSSDELIAFLRIDSNRKYIKLPASNFYLLDNVNRDFSVNPQGHFDLKEFCSFVQPKGFVFLNRQELLDSTHVDFFEALKYLENVSQSFVVTLGKDGAICYHCTERKWWYCPSIYTNNIKSTLGCGDAFAGGFLSAYTQGFSIQQCLAQGVFSAYCATQSASNMITKWFNDTSPNWIRQFYRYMNYFDDIDHLFEFLLVKHHLLPVSFDVVFDNSVNYCWIYP